MRSSWQMTVLVALVALVAGLLLAVELLPQARAQGGGETGRVIVVMGSTERNYAPIVVVDTLEQSLMLYEYSYNSREVELRSVRSYRYDKQLIDYNTDGPTVREVRGRVEQLTGPDAAAAAEV